MEVVMVRNRMIAAVCASTIFLSPTLIASAQARSSGSVSVTITPRGEQAEIIRGGLQIYSMIKSAKNRAKVNQRGESNAAAIAQHGSGNNAQVFQRGRGHEAVVEQTGNSNWLGVFQFGRNSRSNVAQTGNGKSGLVIQGGW
jgi:Curlin associated repeat